MPATFYIRKDDQTMRTDYKELREWTIERLNWLHGFCGDSDLNLEPRRLAQAEEDIAGQIKQIREGRYRVVFLGSFNVGKSTLINALLGDEILPPLLEPCTAKTVHLMHLDKGISVSGIMKNKLDKQGENSLKCLQKGALKVSPDRMTFNLELSSDGAKNGLREILESLVTIKAYSKDCELAKVAKDLAEVRIRMPLPRWAEDIVLTDTPGVHSMSDTEESVTYGVIGQAHLVLFIFDSEHGGNRHDFVFMRRIVENRRRQMFFAINRRDQLEEDDIDPTGERGPGRTIMEGLSTFVREPELFFVSALYALRARQLANGAIPLESILKSRAIRIPYDVETQLRKDPDQGTKTLVEHLLAESGINLFEERIADYLHNENKELAVVAEGLSMLGDLGGDYIAILKRCLAAAEDPSMLDDLKRQRSSMERSLEKTKKAADAAFNLFNVKFSGGMFDGKKYPGLLYKPGELFAEQKIHAKVIDAMERWLLNDDNLANTLKNEKFLPAVRQFESLVDDFQSSAIRDLESDFNSFTGELEGELIKILGDLHEAERDGFAKVDIPCHGVDASQKWEYCRDSSGGAAAGAVFGAGVAFFFFPPMVPIGAAIGAGIGLLTGLLTRTFKSKNAKRDKLMEQFKTQALAILVDGISEEGKERKPSVKEIVQENLMKSRNKIDTESREQFKRLCCHLADEVDRLIAEEETIRKDRETIITRLRPKIESLMDLVKQVNNWRKGE